MLKVQNSFFNELLIVKYIFEKKDDILPLHSHSIETQHITIVLKGKIHLSGPNLNKKINQGEIYDYTDDQQTHEITALEDNTVILNIPKKYNSFLIKEENNQEQQEFEKKYQEEYRKNQIEQMLKTEQESNTHK